MDCLRICAVFLLSNTPLLAVAGSSKLSADQTSVLEDTRAYAMQYTQQLPDFICTQTTHREVAAYMSGTSTPVLLDNSSDIIEEQLSYVAGKERYIVLTIDGKKSPQGRSLAIRRRHFVR